MNKTEKVDPMDVMVHFSFSSRPRGYPISDVDCITHIRGYIFLQEVEDDDCGEIVGETKWILFQIGTAHTYGVDAMDLMDSESHDCLEAYEQILCNESIMNELGGGFVNTVLMGVHTNVHQELRGRDIGYHAVKTVLQQFADSTGTIVIIRPAPLPEDKDGKVLDIGDAHKVACNKLMNHWGRLGFKMVQDSDFAVLSSDNSHCWNDPNH